ncbi:MAG: DUF3737 family protein [Muribaculaceae bacterium]|nr:DUF3737 family protein [Muribaculaceae bacterium]
MKTIRDEEFGGERPLFASRDIRLEGVVIHAGESALKNCSNIEAVGCRFEGKYPFWHVDGFRIYDCLFTAGARAALWYSRGIELKDTLVEAPKMFREMHDLSLENVRIPDAAETFWHCSGVRLRDVEVANADYLFMHSSDIDIDGYRQNGNYSFQYCRNVVIRNAVLNTKDAFWNTENVTVYDSEINGEYLGWHSRGLRLVNCRISGTQPLCYASGLVLENCTFAPDADLAFEDSDLVADIRGAVTSVKNPRSGSIAADYVGDLILDENVKAPADCRIRTGSYAQTDR